MAHPGFTDLKPWQERREVNGKMDPESLHYCVLSTPPKKIITLISKTLENLALIMEREGELEVRGWQEGLRSSTKKGELFLMQYTDI